MPDVFKPADLFSKIFFADFIFHPEQFISQNTKWHGKYIRMESENEGSVQLLNFFLSNSTNFFLPCK